MGRGSAVMSLLRPVTLAPVLVVAVLFGLLGAGRLVGDGDLLRLVLAGALLVVANGLSNVVNGLGDAVEDAVHPDKQDRPTVNGDLSPTALMSTAVVGWGAALFVALLLLPVDFALIYLVILGFAWTYSFPPRLKSRLGWNMAAIATPRGALGIAAAWSVFGSLYDPRLWEVLAVTVPYVVLANESRNIADADADRFAGVQTVTSVWGERAGRIVTGVGFLAPFVVVLALNETAWDPWLFLTVFLALGTVAALLLRLDGPRLWRAFYLGFAALSVLFFLPVVVH